MTKAILRDIWDDQGRDKRQQDILDNMELGFMSMFQARNGQWAVHGAPQHIPGAPRVYGGPSRGAHAATESQRQVDPDVCNKLAIRCICICVEAPAATLLTTLDTSDDTNADIERRWLHCCATRLEPERSSALGPP